jgi:hypothetical protein
VGKSAICTYCEHLYPKGLELLITDGDRRQFRRSNKRKIPRVEAKNDPFAFVI